MRAVRCLLGLAGVAVVTSELPASGELVGNVGVPLTGTMTGKSTYAY